MIICRICDIKVKACLLLEHTTICAELVEKKNSIQEIDQELMQIIEEVAELSQKY
jgi:hypothetical protein